MVITSTKSEDSDSTKLFTSTPVKGNPPPLGASTIETSSGTHEPLPSEIFGSPIGSDQNQAQIQTPTRDSFEEEEDLCDREIEENLKRMKASLEKAKETKKRKFFEKMLKG